MEHRDRLVGTAGRAFTAIVAACLLLLGLGTVAWAAWPDLSEERMWSYGVSPDQIEAVSQGYDDGLWRPDEPLSRAHFARMAVKEFGLTPVAPAQPSFVDVPPSNPYYVDIETAAGAGVIKGREDRTFDPAGTISRQQAIAIVGRGLARLRGADLDLRYTPARLEEIIFGFRDGSDVAPVLWPEISFAAEKGLAQGGPDGRLRPLELITRIQGAVLLARLAGRQAAYDRPIEPYYATTMLRTTTTGPGTATLRGVVRTDDGAPFFGTVALLDAQGTHLDWQYTRGEFSFVGLLPGDYRLVVYSPDYVSQIYAGLPAQNHAETDGELVHVGTEDVEADFVRPEGPRPCGSAGCRRRAAEQRVGELGLRAGRPLSLAVDGRARVRPGRE